MARMARLLVYDSDDEAALKEQIEKSLPEGIHHLAVKITILDVTDFPFLMEEIENTIF